MAVEDRVPMRWPAGWDNPAALGLLKGTPVNCLIAGQRAGLLREPAAKLGIAVLDTPPDDVAVIDGTWPGMRISQARRRDDAEAGPTGAPWIDSNGWAVQLARARASKPVWVAFDPPKDAGTLTPDRFQLAAADVAVAGGRWIVSLDDATAAALGRGDAPAVAGWRQVAAALASFEGRKAWRDWTPMGSLAVISDFAGDNEFLATEFLNLAARRNLLYRVVDKARAAQFVFSGLRAALTWTSRPRRRRCSRNWPGSPRAAAPSSFPRRWRRSSRVRRRQAPSTATTCAPWAKAASRRPGKSGTTRLCSPATRTF